MFESNMFEKGNNHKESLVMSIGEVGKLLGRNRQFVELCIKHKLLICWTITNPNTKKQINSNRKPNTQIPRQNFEQFYKNYCKEDFYDKLSIEAKKDLSAYFLPAYLMHFIEINGNFTNNESGLNSTVYSDAFEISEKLNNRVRERVLNKFINNLK